MIIIYVILIGCTIKAPFQEMFLFMEVISKITLKGLSLINSTHIVINAQEFPLGPHQWYVLRD